MGACKCALHLVCHNGREDPLLLTKLGDICKTYIMADVYSRPEVKVV